MHIKVKCVKTKTPPKSHSIQGSVMGTKGGRYLGCKGGIMEGIMLGFDLG